MKTALLARLHGKQRKLLKLLETEYIMRADNWLQLIAKNHFILKYTNYYFSQHIWE